MADPQYPSLASNGVVGRAMSNRASQIDAAESAALGSPPPAISAPPPRPVAPAPSPGIMDRIKGALGFKHDSGNMLPAGTQHEAGSRGMAKDDQ